MTEIRSSTRAIFAVVLADLQQPRPIIQSLGNSIISFGDESIETISGPAFAREFFQKAA